MVSWLQRTGIMFSWNPKIQAMRFGSDPEASCFQQLTTCRTEWILVWFSLGLGLFAGIHLIVWCQKPLPWNKNPQCCFHFCSIMTKGFKARGFFYGYCFSYKYLCCRHNSSPNTIKMKFDQNACSFLISSYSLLRTSFLSAYPCSGWDKITVKSTVAFQGCKKEWIRHTGQTW